MNPLREISATLGGWIGKWLPSKAANESERPTQFYIKFLGGPLDGHYETVSRASFTDLPDSIEIPISRAQFDFLEGIEPQKYAPTTSVAIYDLIRVDCRWQFRFRRQVAAGGRRDRNRSQA